MGIELGNICQSMNRIDASKSPLTGNRRAGPGIDLGQGRRTRLPGLE